MSNIVRQFEKYFNPKLVNYNRNLALNNLEMKHLGFPEFVNKDKLLSYLKKHKSKQFYVLINLDDSKGKGTHWAMLLKYNGLVFYFDSFGYPPLQTITDFFKTKSVKRLYSDYTLQNWKYATCGWWNAFVLYHLIEALKKKPTKEQFHEFITLFLEKKRNIIDLERWIDALKSEPKENQFQEFITLFLEKKRNTKYLERWIDALKSKLTKDQFQEFITLFFEKNRNTRDLERWIKTLVNF